MQQKIQSHVSEIRRSWYRIQNSRGFSVIELVAVTAVIALISGVLLVSNSRFGGKVLLENLAYDIALSIRQAQVYGISVQRFGTNTFSAGYGVHFDSSSGTQTSYAMFADATTKNGLYDPPGGSCGSPCELVQAAQLERGFLIAKLCAPAGSDAFSCTAVNVLDILFRRPEPDAWISAGGLSCSLALGVCHESARIVVTSPRGDTSSVVIENNGQITVNK